MPIRSLVLVLLWLPLIVGKVCSQDAAKRPALRDLDSHFPFTVPESAEQWQQRSDNIRLQTRMALGLHPLPKLAAPVPTIHSRREMDGYTIEKVILESLPGLFVTGNLYRPLDEAAAASAPRRPAVMYAHGHWDRGRFYEASAGEVRRLLASGAERFENAAINHMQAACVQLARMGCVVFQYDMIGYADSQQISFGRAHRYGLEGPNPPATEDGWPLYSTIAEGYGQSVMSLQTINTLQSFEMLRNLTDVDPERIVITGASGGGTQSFIASAVEPRLAGSMPAVMVSTGMQGGCTCENACGLRIDTGNIELAALTAPRPLAMTTADDWTKNMPQDGFPELVRLYQLVGAPKAVELFPAAHFPHNYNHVARVALYGWVNRLFGLGQSEPILERDFELLRAAELTVWDDEHPQPAGGIDFERALCARWAAQIDAALQPTSTTSQDQLETQQRLLREGWTALTRWGELTRGRLADSGTLTKLATTEQAAAQGGIVLRRAGAADADKQPASGTVAWSLTVQDPVGGQGDSHAEAPLVANPRPAAAYTYGYNAPPLIRRLGVVLEAIDQVAPTGDEPLELVVDDEHIFLAAAAALRRPAAVATVRWITTQEADYNPFAAVQSIRDPQFLPNALRYQGLPGLLALLGDRVVRVEP